MCYIFVWMTVISISCSTIHKSEDQLIYDIHWSGSPIELNDIHTLHRSTIHTGKHTKHTKKHSFSVKKVNQIAAELTMNGVCGVLPTKLLLLRVSLGAFAMFSLSVFVSSCCWVEVPIRPPVYVQRATSTNPGNLTHHVVSHILTVHTGAAGAAFGSRTEAGTVSFSTMGAAAVASCLGNERSWPGFDYRLLEGVKLWIRIKNHQHSLTFMAASRTLTLASVFRQVWQLHPSQKDFFAKHSQYLLLLLIRSQMKFWKRSQSQHEECPRVYQFATRYRPCPN